MVHGGPLFYRIDVSSCEDKAFEFITHKLFLCDWFVSGEVVCVVGATTALTEHWLRIFIKMIEEKRHKECPKRIHELTNKGIAFCAPPLKIATFSAEDTIYYGFVLYIVYNAEEYGALRDSIDRNMRSGRPMVVVFPSTIQLPVSSTTIGLKDVPEGHGLMFRSVKK